MSKKKEDIIKIFIVLGLYSFAGGFFYNFNELWLAENNLSLKTISTVLSLCAIITVSVIFICSNIIKQHQIKKFTCILLLIKFISVFLLFILYKSGLNILIKFITIIDSAVDTQIYICLYPLISIIKKDDKLYAARSLIYDAMYYLAVIIVGILLGKTIWSLKITYNSYCFIASIFILISYFVLRKVDIEKYIKKKDDNNQNDFKNIFKIIKKDKISLYYLLYVFTGNAAYYTILGMMMTTITEIIGYSPSYTSNLILGVGFLSVGIGYLILAKFTFKNDYINLSIKYGGRLLLYIIAFIINKKIIILIAMIFTEILSLSYSNITDAPYINRFEGKKQLEFSSIRSMLSYFSKAIGTLLCGLAFTLGIKINFFWASILVVFQLIFAFIALNLRNKENQKA